MLDNWFNRLLIEENYPRKSQGKELIFYCPHTDSDIALLTPALPDKFIPAILGYAFERFDGKIEVKSRESPLSDKVISCINKLEPITKSFKQFKRAWGK